MQEATPRELLVAYVDAHNAGVRTGDFESMLALFREDASFEITGLDVGPFVGRRAVRDAFARMPPDDELRLLAVRQSDEERVAATYGWARSVGKGTLRLTAAHGSIVRLVVRRDDAPAMDGKSG